jgi:hypothetical protein
LLVPLHWTIAYLDFPHGLPCICYTIIGHLRLILRVLVANLRDTISWFVILLIRALWVVLRPGWWWS